MSMTSLQKEKYQDTGADNASALGKARQPGVDFIVELVMNDEAFPLVKGSKNKRELHPRIQRAFQGAQGIRVARSFIEACKQNPALKAKAEEQGFELEGLSEQLDEADRENRNSATK